MKTREAYALFEEVKEDISADQYGYYFAGIIRAECMVSECFGGMKESEVHNVLMMETGHSHTVTFRHPRRGRVVYEVPEDIKKWSMRKMASYIGPSNCYLKC